MFRIFRLGSKKFLGVDIGTSSIKIVELSRRGKEHKLENYGEAKTSFTEAGPFRTSKKDTLLLSDINIARAIEDICEEAGITTKEVNFSIPDFATFFTSFELPIMTKEELPEVIKYEVRPYVPLPISEITLDWKIIEGEVTKTPLKVLVAAIPNGVVAQYQEIARLSDLKLRVLEPEAFSLTRALVETEKKPSPAEAKEGKKEKKIIGLIDTGARSTTCNVVEEGVLKRSHSFNIAGNELTNRLARSLNIDYNKAEELKIKQGLTLTEGPQQNIRRILIPLVDLILEEIKKVFRNFYQDEGKEIEKIILAGGLALLPGLKEYFFVELKKEIVISNPFINISYPSILKETLKEEGPSYAVAVGLALKGLE